MTGVTGVKELQKLPEAQLKGTTLKSWPAQEETNAQDQKKKKKANENAEQGNSVWQSHSSKMPEVLRVNSSQRNCIAQCCST